jgi:hypothetical protein
MQLLGGLGPAHKFEASGVPSGMLNPPEEADPLLEPLPVFPSALASSPVPSSGPPPAPDAAHADTAPSANTIARNPAFDGFMMASTEKCSVVDA